MTKLSWRVAAVTDCGRKRLENQDNFFVSPDSMLFAVADGMGGARNGAVASRIAIDSVKSRWNNERPARLLDDVTKEWLVETVSEANVKICKVSGDDHSAHRMGTTIVIAAHTEDGKVGIAHVGDSRAYLIRAGNAEPLTVDHSVVMEMYQRKQLTKQQAYDSVFKNLLTRCLGHQDDIVVDDTAVEPRPGDWIILCSDGLNSELTDQEIGKLISRCSTPDEACQKLLDKTLSHGGNDNVTIVAIQYFDQK
jgi:serine/threonine protein phosphatase PrpC